MGGAAAVWDDVRAAIALKGACVAHDLPGHGARKGEASLDDVAAMANDVARAAPFERFVAVGHSMGGAVVQTLLHRHPGRITRAVLVASALRFPAAPMMLAALDADPLAFRAMFKDGLGPAHVVPRCRRLADECSDAALRADLVACAAFDARAFASARDDVDVVVVGGDLDEVTPPKAWRRLAEAWRARVVAAGPRGHTLPEEAPLDVVNAVFMG